MEDDTNIFVAAGDGDIDKVRAFVAGGVDVNIPVNAQSQDSNGYSAVHASASYGNADILRWLLQNGGRVDLVDADGDTPLHACESAECAALLLSAGAVLDALNSKGLTPYHVAVMEYREEMVEWLSARYVERGLTLPEVQMDGDDDDEEGEEDAPPSDAL